MPCAVPNCKTQKKMPRHRIPFNKRESWLVKINRTEWLDLPENEIKKKYICYAHFRDDMVKPYTLHRKLYSHAEPVLLLHLDENGIEIDDTVVDTLPGENKMETVGNPAVPELPDSGLQKVGIKPGKPVPERSDSSSLVSESISIQPIEKSREIKYVVITKQLASEIPVISRTQMMPMTMNDIQMKIMKQQLHDYKQRLYNANKKIVRLKKQKLAWQMRARQSSGDMVDLTDDKENGHQIFADLKKEQ